MKWKLEQSTKHTSKLCDYLEAAVWAILAFFDNPKEQIPTKPSNHFLWWIRQSGELAEFNGNQWGITEWCLKHFCVSYSQWDL